MKTSTKEAWKIIGKRPGSGDSRVKPGFDTARSHSLTFSIHNLGDLCLGQASQAPRQTLNARSSLCAPAGGLTIRGTPAGPTPWLCMCHPWGCFLTVLCITGLPEAAQTRTNLEHSQFLQACPVRGAPNLV